MNLRIFELEDYYDKHEFSTPYLLSQSDCESMTIQELLAMEPDSEQEFANSWLGYTEAKGNPILREQISCLYQGIKPDNILVHAGAEEAIYNFMQVYLESGDHVIYMAPAYQSLYEIAASLKCEVSDWQLKQNENGGWKICMDELKQLIKPNTKLLVINTPHNPTGYCLSEEELNEIAQIARKHHIFIFCDQVYKGLEWDGKNHPWFCDLYDNSLSLGVMSKAYGLPGLRIGWIATQNKDVYHKMVNFKYYTTICNSGPSEFLSIVALKHSERLLIRNQSIIKNNLDYADSFFKKYSDIFLNNRPFAGPIAFHKLLLSEDIQKFCRDLIAKKGVLLLPGNVYETNGNYFRMGYGRKNFKEALAKLEEYIKECILS